MRADMRQTISAAESDRRFDDGEELEDFIDWDHPTRLNLETQRVNVDFPRWMLEALDATAARLAVPRESVIKLRIDDRLRKERQSKA